VKNILGGLLDGIKKDSAKVAPKNNAVKDAAKSVLGGLLNRKKKPEIKNIL
jgi:hypothetical protein